MKTKKAKRVTIRHARKRLLDRMAADQFAADIGIQLVKVEIGHSKARLSVQPRHLNGVGIVQGGVLFTLADFAFAAACNHTEEKVISIETNISFLKSTKNGTLYAEAQEVSRSKHLTCCEVRVTDTKDNLLASLRVRGYVMQ